MRKSDPRDQKQEIIKLSLSKQQREVHVEEVGVEEGRGEEYGGDEAVEEVG